jgi:hypothetical protein
MGEMLNTPEEALHMSLAYSKNRQDAKYPLTSSIQPTIGLVYLHLTWFYMHNFHVLLSHVKFDPSPSLSLENKYQLTR